MNNKIKTYVDALFSDIPDNESTRELKEEILSNLDERMNDYISQGMSENKAYTKAIIELGDIDEILREGEILGDKDTVANGADNYKNEYMNNNEYTKNEEYIKNGDYTQYDRYNGDLFEKELLEARKKHTKYMSIGVMIIILSMIPALLSGSFESEWSEIFWISIMFIFIAVGVGMIIYSGNYSPKNMKRYMDSINIKSQPNSYSRPYEKTNEEPLYTSRKEKRRYNKDRRKDYFEGKNKDRKLRDMVGDDEYEEAFYKNRLILKLSESILWGFAVLVYLFLGFTRGMWFVGLFAFFAVPIIMNIVKILILISEVKESE